MGWRASDAAGEDSATKAQRVTRLREKAVGKEGGLLGAELEGCLPE
jgi:hypothetical protein